jgi:Ricin-type beta-trefoil lectin domain
VSDEPGAPDEEKSQDEDGAAAARVRIPPWAPEVAFRETAPDESSDPAQSSPPEAMPWAWEHGAAGAESRVGALSRLTARSGSPGGGVRFGWLVVVGVCLLVAGAGAIVLSTGGGTQSRSDHSVELMPGADRLDQSPVASLSLSAIASPHGTPRPTPKPTRSGAPTILRSPLASVPLAVLASPIVAVNPARPPAATPAAVPVSPTSSPTKPASSPPPAVAYSGVVTGLEGFCLDDFARRTVDGNQIDIYGCNGTPSQAWTVEPDGTMQVIGMCLDVSGSSPGSTVDVWTCDGGATQVWRAGSGGTLVNVGLGLCLEDPDSSTTAGTVLDIAACTASADQRWVLPTG